MACPIRVASPAVPLRVPSSVRGAPICGVAGRRSRSDRGTAVVEGIEYQLAEGSGGLSVYQYHQAVRAVCGVSENIRFVEDDRMFDAIDQGVRISLGPDVEKISQRIVLIVGGFDVY